MEWFGVRGLRGKVPPVVHLQSCSSGVTISANVVAAAREAHLLWKPKKTEVKLAYIKTSSCPLDRDWAILMQMRSPNPHNLIKKITVLIYWNRDVLIDW